MRPQRWRSSLGVEMERETGIGTEPQGTPAPEGQQLTKGQQKRQRRSHHHKGRRDTRPRPETYLPVKSSQLPLPLESYTSSVLLLFLSVWGNHSPLHPSQLILLPGKFPLILQVLAEMPVLVENLFLLLRFQSPTDPPAAEV